MEGEQRGRERFPKRCYQCNRLEDQLWESAYERLWPTVRKALERKLEDTKERQHASSLTMAKGA